jgi:serine/threonine protein kinase
MSEDVFPPRGAGRFSAGSRMAGYRLEERIGRQVALKILASELAEEPVDGRTDQYALGCSAFELLCGEPPFQRDDLAAAVHAHLSGPPPSAIPRLPGLPSEVDRVFARVLANAPADRYGTCQEFADALKRALGPRPPQAADAGSAPPEPPTNVALPDRMVTTEELMAPCNGVTPAVPGASRGCPPPWCITHRRPNRDRPRPHGKPPERRCTGKPGNQ